MVVTRLSGYYNASTRNEHTVFTIHKIKALRVKRNEEKKIYQTVSETCERTYGDRQREQAITQRSAEPQVKHVILGGLFRV